MLLVIPKKIPLVKCFFFLVIAILPIIDNLNGALFKLHLMSEGAIGSPSQLSRFALFIFVIWLINKAHFSQQIRLLLMATCYFLLIEVIHACFHMNLNAFLYGVVFSMKILFALGCYYYVVNWLDFDKERTIYVVKMVINYGTVVSILVLTAYFSGFHIANYGIGLATRGLFISGNGLGIVLGVSTILLVYITKKITLLTFLQILLLLTTTALLGTKASLVFLLFALLLLSIKLFRQAPLKTSVVLFLLSLYLLPILIELFSGIFENIIFKFNNIDDKLHFFASSRDRFITDAFEQMNTIGFKSLKVLIGGGAYYAYTDYADLLIVRKALENDLFELFFAYGLYIALIYVLFYFFAVTRSLQNGNRIFALILSLVFFHSITMGHVLFNGTSAITYSLCLALAVKGARIRSDDF